MTLVRAFLRDASRRSSWCDHIGLLLYAIGRSNDHLMRRFR